MVKYNYSKYTSELSFTGRTFINVADESPWTVFTREYPHMDPSQKLYETLVTNNYLDITTDSGYILEQGMIYHIYNTWGNKRFYFEAYNRTENVQNIVCVYLSGGSMITFNVYSNSRFTQNSNLTYFRGTLVQSGIVAEDGTYPTDGKHTDGFWYVRGTVANTAPTTPGAFTAPTGELETGDTKTIAWVTVLMRNTIFHLMN